MGMYNKKAFCKGVLCRKDDRKFTSIHSGKRMCGLCSVQVKGGYVTIDEFLSPKYNVDWEKMNKDLDKMFTKPEIKLVKKGVTN